MSQASIPLLAVLEQAARMSGFLRAAGRGLSGSEQTEMLHIFNATIDGLKTERCFVYQVVRTAVNFKANQQDYGVGDLVYAPTDGSAFWNVERPEEILGAGFLVPTNDPTETAEVPMEVAVNYVQWKNIVTKQVRSSQPRFLYYRPTLPTGTATVWPVPYVDSQGVIYTIGTVGEMDDVMTPILWPQGYREFLEYWLAMQAHHRHPQCVMDPQVPILAREYKSRVMANQLKPLLISSDPAVMQSPTLPGLRWFDARSWPGGY